MNPVNVGEYLDQFRKTRVLCVGDIMVDHFVSGTVVQLSEEAPVPVLRFDTKKSVLGGVGNVLRTLAHLDIQTYLVTVVGADSCASELENLISELPGNPVKNGQITLIRDDSRLTTEVTRYLSGNHNFLRVDKDSTQNLSAELEEALLEAAFEYLPNIDAIIMSDYQKGVLSEKVVNSLISQARLLGKKVLVDPVRAKSYEKFNGTHILKPNRFELSAITGNMPVETDDEVLQATQRLATMVPDVDLFLVTRDHDGMSLIQPGSGIKLWERSHVINVVDTVGAGDTVLAVMAACLVLDIPLQRAMFLASIAAAIVVAKPGTATVTHEEIRQFHETSSKGTTKFQKIVSLEVAHNIVSQWRAENNKCSIGFTNGCFDLLHKGHLTVLQEGKMLCSKLIVAINSDDSVKRLKGSSRPIQNSDTRAAVLAALEMVDLVLVFPEDSPTNLIQELKPDVLFKGGDYTIDQIVGKHEVEQYGGKVIITSHLPGNGTTQMVNEILNSGTD